MTIKTKILIHMLENKDKAENIRDIATSLGIDYKNCYEAIKSLTKDDAIKLERFGMANKISLSSNLSKELLLAEHERQANFLKNHPDISLVLDYFKRNLGTKLYSMLLFGSFAKGSATKHSDIDLLFIVPSKSTEKDIRQVISMIPSKIHALVFTEAEFVAMNSSKIVTVGSEAILHNVILHGIEPYYAILNT